MSTSRVLGASMPSMAFVCFFFSSRRRHTRWPRDWSSDVCSSDLHSHHDHVAHEGELGVPVRTDALEVGGLRVEAIATPGHSDDMVAFVVNGEAVFTGDTLFKDSVGGGNF